MEKIRLYIDEDLTDRLAVALRSRGYDAVSAHEVNMRSKTDKEIHKYLETLIMMGGAETAFSEWLEPEEDIYKGL